MAGDRVALSRWPFVSQNPAFVVNVGTTPVHLMVAIDNEATSRAPVWLATDASYRETQLRQSNLSGMNMGLGLMVVVVTVLGAAVQRRRASVLLAGVATWVFITVISLNGYMAVWLTPQWPALNDASKQFTGVMMSALMFTLTAEALDQRYLTRVERWAQAGRAGTGAGLCGGAGGVAARSLAPPGGSGDHAGHAGGQHDHVRAERAARRALCALDHGRSGLLRAGRHHCVHAV
jgi:hypothetical protein